MRRLVLMFALMIYAAVSTSAQDSFRWIDFHPSDSVTNHDTGRDEDIIV